MRKLVSLTLLCLIGIVTLNAQQASLSGRVNDSTEKKNLHLATVALLKRSDSTLLKYARSDINGKFSFSKVDTGKYLILVSYPHFADYMDQFEVTGNNDLGTIYMTPKSKILNEVVIKAGSSIRIKGDTTEFTADSFKVKDGATVEDLLKKLPGFTVNNKGEIVAQGKRVDKVLVDGEEFFGDDPTMATQNISSKAVDKVQVFDTKTDQQQLTGMTSGTEGKTVNIKLKENSKKGAFGKAHAGSDLKKYVDAKALYNKFVGKKKFSVYGTRTNITAGSLNWEERDKLGIEDDYEYDELSGYYYSSSDEFNNWNIRGLPDAYTAGTLFSNKWNEDKHNVNLSYRYNKLITKNIGTTLTQNISSSGITYSNRYTSSNSLNQQHAANGKYEWKIDSLTSIKFSTAILRKTGVNRGYNNGEFIGTTLDTVNQSFNDYDNNTLRNKIDNQIVYNQRFKKKDRVWYTTFRYGVTKDDNEGLNYTRIRYFQNGIYDHADTVDQQRLFDGKSTTFGLKSTFSEPLSVKWSLIAEYGHNQNNSSSLKNTYEKNNTGKYEELVQAYSNNFELDAFSNSANAIFRFVDKKWNLGLGSGFSSVKLRLKNLDDNTNDLYKFFNLTPQMQVRFTPKVQTNIGFNYRGNSIQPNINQLQPLRDNTDQLNETLGNPDLKVGFNHQFRINFNQYKVLKRRGIWANFSYNKQQNAITQYNTIDNATGKRTSYPVNVNGNSNWNMWLDYNKELGEKKPSFGVGINGNGRRFISFVNGDKAITKSFTAQLNLNIRMEVEEKFNFDIRPSIGYNVSKSSLAQNNNNNYFTYGIEADTEIELPWKMTFETEFEADLRQKIDAFASNTNIVLWNAELTKKVFKKKNGKISLVANDILNDNKGFTRNISNTFVSDDRYQRISRYFLLKFEWSFNQMAGGESK